MENITEKVNATLLKMNEIIKYKSELDEFGLPKISTWQISLTGKSISIRRRYQKVGTKSFSGSQSLSRKDWGAYFASKELASQLTERLNQIQRQWLKDVRTEISGEIVPLAARMVKLYKEREIDAHKVIDPDTGKEAKGFGKNDQLNDKYTILKKIFRFFERKKLDLPDWESGQTEFLSWMKTEYKSSSRKIAVRQRIKDFYAFSRRQLGPMVLPEIMWDRGFSNEAFKKDLGITVALAGGLDADYYGEDKKGKYIPNDELKILLAATNPNYIIDSDLRHEIERCGLPDSLTRLHYYFLIYRHMGIRRSEGLALPGNYLKAKNTHFNLNAQLARWDNLTREKGRIVGTENAKLIYNTPKGGCRSIKYLSISQRVLRGWIRKLPILTKDQINEMMISLTDRLLDRDLLTAKYRFHDFRRTCITDWYRFYDKKIVMQSAGHKKSATTDGYLRDIEALDEQKNLSDAYWFDGKLTPGRPTGNFTLTVTLDSSNLLEELGKLTQEEAISLIMKSQAAKRAR